MESRFSDITKETPFARDSVKNGSDDINSGNDELALNLSNKSTLVLRKGSPFVKLLEDLLGGLCIDLLKEKALEECLVDVEE
jgi:hypothetical protein